MFTHVMIGSNDLAHSKSFYDATFVALGGGPGEMDARGRLIYSHDGGRLMITKPIDGNPRPTLGPSVSQLRAVTMSSPGTRPALRMAGRR